MTCGQSDLLTDTGFVNVKRVWHSPNIYIVWTIYDYGVWVFRIFINVLFVCGIHLYNCDLKNNSLYISDRPGVGESFHLEKMEEDLTLALKCQFLLNHGQCDKLFPKTVEILVDLRSISTMHSEKILNSTVEVDGDDWQG